MARVLVVDDNEDNRRVLRRMLELEGHQVSSARNGELALAEARRGNPDLILMDLSMPDMNGWDATRHLKAEEALCTIPVVVVTGHLTSDEIRRAQEVGCEDVVSKPVDYYGLADKVAQHTRVRTGA